MLKYYRPLLRLPTKASLPVGIVWDYVEIPRMDSFRFNRSDLRVSRFNYGIIKCKELSREQCENFDLREVWLYDGDFIEINPNFQHTEILKLSPNKVAMLQLILRRYSEYEAVASEHAALDDMLSSLSQLKQPE